MKVLVVDDHPLMRGAVRELLKELDASIEVLEAGDCAAALEIADRQPDLALILLDILLPGRSGLDALSDFRNGHPAIPVVVLSASSQRDDVTRAIDAGAMGFIPKTEPGRVLISALRLVLAGGVYLPSVMMTQTLPGGPVPVAASTAPTGKTLKDLGLTGRQVEVLSLLIQGMSNKHICRALDMAEGTVKVHISAILQALGVNSRTQAVVAVSRLGIALGGISGKRPVAGHVAL